MYEYLSKKSDSSDGTTQKNASEEDPNTLDSIRNMVVDRALHEMGFGDV